MHKLTRSIFIAMTMMLCSLSPSVLKGDCDYSRSSPRNNLTPTFRCVITPRFCGESAAAVSFMGEIGQKLNRINGTFGLALNERIRVKIGAEFLNEKLRYSFYNGHVSRWMNQYAVGGVYQYVIDCNYIYAFDLAGRFSHAPSTTLSNIPCLDTFLNRRVAGSDTCALAAGFTLIPWSCAALNLSAVYDCVEYQIKFHNTRQKEYGVGAIIALTQQLTPDVFLNLRSEFRRPYNYYEGQLKWTTCIDHGTLSIGIFGGRVEGRHDLPSSITGGIELGFDFGVEKVFNPTYYARSIACYNDASCMESCDFLNWLATPAVYMPQVLTKADQRLQDPCPVPISVEIPDQEFNVGDVFTMNITPFFNGRGSPLTYSSNLDLTIDVDGASAYVDPVSGQFYAMGRTSGFLRVSITATNECGSTSQYLDILVND